MNAINDFLGLSLDAKDLTFFQISLRGAIVFVAVLIMLRTGDRRFLSNRSAFDTALGFILASMLARAINGSSSFWPTIFAGFVIVWLHRFLAYFTREVPWFGRLVKGDAEQFIKNGAIDHQALKRQKVSEQDLIEDIRLTGNIEDPKKVKAAYYERNGQVSVVKHEIQ